VTTLPQRNRAALIKADNAERILANIDANRGNGRGGFAAV
jgi:hypothetical protein